MFYGGEKRDPVGEAEAPFGTPLIVTLLDYFHTTLAGDYTIYFEVKTNVIFSLRLLGDNRFCVM